ncbi:MAG: LuxR C-terminal-related transcriptional regulator [Acidimicrobiales bacterium]
MLIGRAEELATLQAALADRGAVVLVGPAGIGKTALARESLSANATCREAGCLATLAWSPLLVFRRLLAAKVPEAPELVASKVLRTGADAILLDDLQWADVASLDVLSHLVGKVAVVATVRTGEQRSQLVTEALALVGVERLDLGPLLGSDASRLVARRHPELSRAEQDRLMSEAGGNPLLIEELPGAGSDSSTLVSALLGRLDGLDAPARDAMDRLAVLGRPASAALLGSGVHALVGSGLASPLGEEVEVRHALLAEVLVEHLGHRADALRRQLAETVPDAEAAHLLARTGEREQARELALRAAEATQERRELAELLELAVRCAGPGVVDLDNRLTAARLFVEYDELDRATDLCAVDGREELPAVQRGALMAMAAEVAWFRGQAAEATELVESALSDLRGTDTPEEVRALAGSSLPATRVSLDGRPALHRAWKAVAVADRIGSYQAFARQQLASVLLTAREAGWVEQYEEAMVDATRAGDEPLRRSILLSFVLGLWLSGRGADACRLAWAEVSAGPSQNDAHWLSLHAYAAVTGLFTGTDRRTLIERHAPVLAAVPVFRYQLFMEAAVGLAWADLGRHLEAAATVQGAPMRAGHDPQARSVGWWLVAEAAWLAGRADEAQLAAAAVRELGVGDYPSAMHARLAAAHAERERGGGPPPGPEPVPSLPAWRAVPSEWRGLVAAAEGRHDDAVADFDAAADAWRDHDVRSEVRCRWAAADETRRAWDAPTSDNNRGGADPSKGNGGAGVPREVVDRLRRTLQLAEGRQMLPLAARARRSLRAAGVASRVSSTAGRVGLTAREEEVLHLVGAGLTSVDIAATLGLEPSTVDSFVRSATTKLGVSTRLAAAAMLGGAEA